MAIAHPRLVHLVTRHFNDLKGFDTLPVALALGGAEWGWLWTGSQGATFFGLCAGLVVGIVASVFVADGYTQLGRVSNQTHWRIVPRLMAIAIPLAMQFQAAFVPGPSIVWIAIGLYFVWLAIDGWPWRWYHAFTFASAVYVAFGRAAVAHPTDFAWMAPRLWVFAGALVATSIADHFLLLRAMRIRPFDEGTVSENADAL